MWPIRSRDRLRRRRSCGFAAFASAASRTQGPLLHSRSAEGLDDRHVGGRRRCRRQHLRRGRAAQGPEVCEEVSALSPVDASRGIGAGPDCPHDIRAERTTVISGSGGAAAELPRLHSLLISHRGAFVFERVLQQPAGHRSRERQIGVQEHHLGAPSASPSTSGSYAASTIRSGPTSPMCSAPRPTLPNARSRSRIC